MVGFDGCVCVGWWVVCVGVFFVVRGDCCGYVGGD